MFNWYGDGECDAFCAQRDTDCASDARTPELASASYALASKISMADAAKQVDVEVPRVGALVVVTDEADARDVDEGGDPDPCRSDDEVAEPFNRQRSDRAGVVPRRHAGSRADRVGVDAPVGQLVEHVRVKVDQTWRHDLPGRVDDAERRLCRDVAVDRRDAVARDGHVEPPLVGAAGIDDLAAADEDVESHWAGASEALTKPPIAPATSSSNTTAPSSSEHVRIGRRNACGCSVRSSTARPKSASV